MKKPWDSQKKKKKKEEPALTLTGHFQLITRKLN